MIAGTTQALLINLGVDLSTVDKVIFSFANHNRDIVLQKVYPGDAEIVDGKLYVPLTQADTLCLTGTYNLEMQVNFKGGVVSKTSTYQRSISKTLATEIVDGNAPTSDTVDVIDATVTEGVAIVGNGLPSGGTTGQVLTKSGSADYAVEWQDPTGGNGVAEKFAHITCTRTIDAEKFELSCDLTYSELADAITQDTLSSVLFKYRDAQMPDSIAYSSEFVIGVVDNGSGPYIEIGAFIPSGVIALYYLQDGTLTDVKPT